MSVGKTIKQIRKQRKLTQQELADELKLSRSYLSDIENGRKQPSIKTTQALADKLNVTIAYLTSGSKMYSDLTDDEKSMQFIELGKKLAKENTQKESVLKSNLLELIKQDLQYLDVHFLNNMYNFYELEKTNNENLLSLSVMIQQMYEYKGSKNKHVYKDIMTNFSDFLKQYLDIKDGD